MAGEDTTRSPSLAYALGLLSVIVAFTLSANTIGALGVRNGGLGGNPFIKIHPSTYLAAFGAIAALMGARRQDQGVRYLFSHAQGVVVFFLVTIFCALYSLINVGPLGAGIYIDTYLSAGCLAIVMMNASDRQRRLLVRTVLTLCIVNVLISFAESVRQEHFIPLDVNGTDAMDTGTNEFRPAALYTHPLTGAMATAFAMFLFLTLDMSFIAAAACFGILALGLLSFGGRASVAVTVGLIMLRTGVTMLRDMFRRQTNARLVGATFFAVAILVPLAAYLMAATPIGERLVNSWYYDESAEVRVAQWAVFGRLTIYNVMFGTPVARLQDIYEQVGLNGVENPFILLFLNLGIIGLPIFAVGILAYFLYMRRTYPDCGWLLIAAVLILSSSNSVGVKSPDLFMLTACVAGMPRRLRARAGAIVREYSPQFSLSALHPKGLAREVRGRKAPVPSAPPSRGLSTKVVQWAGRARQLGEANAGD